MAKKGVKSSSKPVEVAATGKPDWTATGILDFKSTNSSSMSSDSVVDTTLLFKSDSNMVLVVPDEGIFSDFHAPNWVCFYNYPFEIGISFPFTKLVTDFIKTLDISPSQVMPSAWRILASLDVIEDKHKLRINLSVVTYSYQAKKFNGGLYGLVGHKKRIPLILNLDYVHDRGWKNNFFYVEKASLGDHAAYLREEWNRDDCSADSAIDDVKAAKIVGEILALPLGHRVWPNYMDRPIRHSAPVDPATFAGKLVLKSAAGKDVGGSEPHSRATRSTAAMKDKSKGIVIAPLDTQIDEISSDSGGTPETERMANSGRQFIKEYKRPVIRALEMFGKELFQKRARESGSETPKSSRMISSPSSPQSKKAKVVVPPPPSAVMDATPEIIVDDWKWPDLHRYSVSAEPRSLVHMLAPLLLPETVSGHGSKTADQVMVEAVGHSFHSFQAMLLSHASYRKFSNEIAELKLEHSSFQEKIRVLQEQVFMAYKETNYMRNELTLFAAKVEETEGTFLQETKDTLTQGIMKSRVETMLEYRRGEWDDKDIDEAVGIYNEAYPDDPVNPGDDGSNAAVSGSSVIAMNIQDDNESDEK